MRTIHDFISPLHWTHFLSVELSVVPFPHSNSIPGLVNLTQLYLLHCPWLRLFCQANCITSYIPFHSITSLPLYLSIALFRISIRILSIWFQERLNFSIASSHWII
jgi:hypothetical protein